MASDGPPGTKMGTEHAKWSRAQLIAEIGRLEASTRAAVETEVQRVLHELSVYQEETRVQNEQLLHAQRTLEQSRDRYADLYDFAPLAYVTLDRAGLIVEINLTGCQLLASDRRVLLGAPFATQVAPEDRALLHTHLVRCRSTPGPVRSELRMRTGDKRVLPVELHSRASANGDVIRTAITDTTERRRVEEERRRTLEAREAARAEVRAKDEFLAVLSHELRTPLTPVLAAATAFASRADISADQREVFEMIRRNLELEVRLIDDLLDVTRITRNKLRLERQVVDLHDAVRDAIAMCSRGIEDAGIELEVDLAARRSFVDGDPTRLRQIFWNLLGNAVKFTPREGRIRVVSRNRGGRVRVSVVDTGVGMEPSTIALLFRPFSQGPAADNAPRGLGLGLSICSGLVRAHGGRLEAESAGIGHGTTVSVEMETVDVVSPAARAPSRRHPAITNGRKGSILLVEDHADSARLLARLLGGEGYEVRVAGSVAEAIEAAAQPFDLLISDISLPDGSGRDLVRTLSRERRFPSLAFSGFCTDEDLRRSLEAGFDEHLTKPLDYRKLRAAIENAMSHGGERSLNGGSVQRPSHDVDRIPER